MRIAIFLTHHHLIDSVVYLGHISPPYPLVHISKPLTLTKKLKVTMQNTMELLQIVQNKINLKTLSDDRFYKW